ncbi:MAG TPA: potassium-transporting ATPase subunit C [Gemmataceae bacterium]|jgi:K+-transporting ATPase ATPase C chain
MNANIRANLWLLGITVVLCCILYPLILWTIGQLVFPDKASGSLLDESGRPTREVEKARGSRLIAQPFNGSEYFQPRPSAASYKADASAASNYGANNPKLRYRVAQTLGPIVKYRSGSKKGQLAGPDIEKWFQQDHFKGEPHIVAQWAKQYSSSAQEWVKTDLLNTKHVGDWMKAHPEEVKEWKKDNPDASESKPEDFAVPFFVSFSQTFPGTWPKVSEKRFEQVTEDTNIQANFFDMWLQEHPDVELVEVPADLVMASGSGLDPHITLKNAQYQLDRVVDAWAEKTNADKAEIRKGIEELLNQKAEAPFGGLAGVKLINVLEVNLALPDVMKKLPRRVAGGGGPA